MGNGKGVQLGGIEVRRAGTRCWGRKEGRRRQERHERAGEVGDKDGERALKRPVDSTEKMRVILRSLYLAARGVSAISMVKASATHLAIRLPRVVPRP